MGLLLMCMPNSQSQVASGTLVELERMGLNIANYANPKAVQVVEEDELDDDITDDVSNCSMHLVIKPCTQVNLFLVIVSLTLLPL
jgi:hypothetical protein